jgi:hypothetical protein
LQRSVIALSSFSRYRSEAEDRPPPSPTPWNRRPRGSSCDRPPQASLGSLAGIIDHSLQANSKLDKRDRTGWAKEFWRRSEPALGRRGDFAGDDLGDCAGWLVHESHDGARSCHEYVRLGLGAGIISRAADLANTFIETAATSARTQSALRSRPHDKRHRGHPKIAWTQDSASATESREGQVRGPDVQHAVAADKGRSTLGRRSTSRGRAALQMNEGRRAAPAVLLSTIT